MKKRTPRREPAAALRKVVAAVAEVPTTLLEEVAHALQTLGEVREASKKEENET
jgi:hypothetical protein